MKVEANQNGSEGSVDSETQEIVAMPRSILPPKSVRATVAFAAD